MVIPKNPNKQSYIMFPLGNNFIAVNLQAPLGSYSATQHLLASSCISIMISLYINFLTDYLLK